MKRNKLIVKAIGWAFGFVAVYLGGILIIYPDNHVRAFLMASFITIVIIIFETANSSDAKTVKLTRNALSVILMTGLVALVALYLMVNVGGIDGGRWPLIVALILGVLAAISLLWFEWRKSR